MPNTKYRKFILISVLLSAASLFTASCGENDSRVSNSVSLEHYIEVKPSKGFLDNAVVKVKGTTLLQEFGTDLYSGYLGPGVGFNTGDVITATGGRIRVSGIQMDDTIPLKYMYDGYQRTINITPLTTLVAESMQSSGSQPTLADIIQVKESLIPLIDPGNLLGGNIAGMDGDPEKIPAIEGIGHTIYFTLKGAVDTMKALGYDMKPTHVSRLWGSIADTYINSQNDVLDDVLVEILTDPGFDPQQTFTDANVLSSIIKSVYQKAAAIQETLISAQQSGDKTAFKDASMNLVYTAQTLTEIAPVIRDKTKEKTAQTTANFVNSVTDLISENIDLVRQKAVEDPDNLKDEFAAIGMLPSIFNDKINTYCSPEDITPDSDLCFAITESDINTMVFNLPALPDPEGIIDWNPKDGVILNTIEPDFDLTFSDSVDSIEIEKYFKISITNVSSEKSVVMLYINGEEWISIRIPSENTKVLKKVTDEEYIDLEWNESNTKVTLHVGSYTFEGKTYTLTDGATYRFTFQLLEGATFSNGIKLSPQTIGPAQFSIMTE